MKQARLYLCVCILLPLLFCCSSENAWDIVKTKGSYRTETRNIQPFQSLAVYDGVDVVLEAGTINQVYIEGWSALLPKVQIDVNQQGELTIRDTNGRSLFRNSSYRTLVHVVYNQQINAIALYGDGTIVAKDTLQQASYLSILSENACGSINLYLNASNVFVGTNSDNVADIQLKGELADGLSITSWGNAPIYCDELKTQHVNLHHYGRGELHVWAQQTLKAHVFATGSVYYKGNPVVYLERKGKGNLHHIP